MMARITTARRAIIALGAALAAVVTPAAQADTSTGWGSSVSGQCADHLVYVVPSTLNTASFLPDFLPHGAGTTRIGYQLSLTPGVQVTTVPYNSAWPTTTISYADSYATGIESATRTLAEGAQACPEADVSLFGYSEGADIAAGVVEQIAAGSGPISPERFSSATLMANPSRGYNGAWQAGSAQAGTGLRPAKNYGALAEQVLEICNAGDVVCDTEHVAPTMNEINTPILENSALLRGQIAWDQVAESLGKTNLWTLPAMAMETPAMLVGWLVHFSYLVPGDGVDTGEQFIREHF
ncbi:cutinase family protein [Corynebacterium mastitidis]